MEEKCMRRDVLTNGRGGGFVDDTEDGKTGDGASIFGGRSLCVVKVYTRGQSDINPTMCGSHAGTVTTAWVTLWPRYASAVSFIFVRTMEEISSGV